MHNSNIKSNILQKPTEVILPKLTAQGYKNAASKSKIINKIATK